MLPALILVAGTGFELRTMARRTPRPQATQAIMLWRSRATLQPGSFTVMTCQICRT